MLYLYVSSIWFADILFTFSYVLLLVPISDMDLIISFHVLCLSGFVIHVFCFIFWCHRIHCQTYSVHYSSENVMWKYLSPEKLIQVELYNNVPFSCRDNLAISFISLIVLGLLTFSFQSILVIYLQNYYHVISHKRLYDQS